MRGWSPTLGKSWDLESSGTPECSELNSKGQNTSHWGVLGVIEKVLKRRYRKWPRIGHLDICSPSYGQKKGRPTTKSRKSTSSRCPIRECDMALKRSRRGLQLWFRPRRDPTLQSGVMIVQSPESPAGTNSGQFRNSISGVPTKCAIWVLPRRGAEYTIRGKVVASPPSPGRGESCVSKCPWQVPTPKGVPNAKLTSRGWFFGCRFKLDLLVPLPSLILGLPTRPLYPF